MKITILNKYRLMYTRAHNVLKYCLMPLPIIYRRDFQHAHFIPIVGVRVNDSITVSSMWELTPVGTRYS